MYIRLGTIFMKKYKNYKRKSLTYVPTSYAPVRYTYLWAVNVCMYHKVNYLFYANMQDRNNSAYNLQMLVCCRVWINLAVLHQ
jgi:hypothetical protein